MKQVYKLGEDELDGPPKVALIVFALSVLESVCLSV